MRASPQNATRHARAASRWSALAGEPPEARFPSADRFKLPVSGPKTARPSSASSGRHSPLPPNSCHGICLRTCRASPGRSAWQRPRQHEACCHVLCWPLHGCGRCPEDVAALVTLRFPSPAGVGALKTKLLLRRSARSSNLWKTGREIFQCLEKPAEKVPTSGKSAGGGLLQDAVQHLAYELLFAAWQLADDFELTLDLRLGSALARGPVIALQNVRDGHAERAG